MKLSQLLEEALLGESELEYFGGDEGGPDQHRPTGEKPWPQDHREGREAGEKEPVPLVLGANVIVRTKDGMAVVEGFIEDIMHETRTIRVRDTHSGTDLQIDVDPDRYDVWVMDPEVVGDSPTPGPRHGPNFIRPTRPGPYAEKK